MNCVMRHPIQDPVGHWVYTSGHHSNTQARNRWIVVQLSNNVPEPGSVQSPWHKVIDKVYFYFCRFLTVYWEARYFSFFIRVDDYSSPGTMILKMPPKFEFIYSATLYRSKLGSQHSQLFIMKWFAWIVLKPCGTFKRKHWIRRLLLCAKVLLKFVTNEAEPMAGTKPEGWARNLLGNRFDTAAPG